MKSWLCVLPIEITSSPKGLHTLLLNRVGARLALSFHQSLPYNTNPPTQTTPIRVLKRASCSEVETATGTRKTGNLDGERTTAPRIELISKAVQRLSLLTHTIPHPILLSLW